MTLDEIIAGMEHENTLIGYAVKGQCTSLCSKCQLIAFHAEMEEMVQKWEVSIGAECDGGVLCDNCKERLKCAAELRAKIGENL